MSDSAHDLPVERIVDGHCHVASTALIPRAFAEGAIDNMASALRGRGIDVDHDVLRRQYLARMQDDDCDELVAQMDAARIGRAVLLFVDFTWAVDDCELDLEGLFERQAGLLERHPGRFVLFAGVDPRWGRRGIDLFEAGAREGRVSGLKLYPPCGFSAGDESLDQLFEVCSARKLPVVVHTGATSPALSFDTSQPECLDRAARRFPGVDFILAHGSTAYVESCVMMCGYRPNVYLDISAWQSMPVDHLVPLFTRGINHKIIFGTDWPVFRLQGSQRDFVDQLIGPDGVLRGLHARELEAVFHGTMEALLGE